MAASSSTTSFVLVESFNGSESSASTENDGRMVRFDKECVLIPEYPSGRGPRVVTRSYSLPLWKRRGAAIATTSDSESTDDPSSSTTAPLLSTSAEETHVVLRVPIPSFIRRPSRPHGPYRSTSARSLPPSPRIPLSPCLVQRTPPSPSTEARSPTFSPTRRVSQPIYQRRPEEPTIPLRACCADCVPVTEQSLKEGSTWQEKFSRGARRRRSASLDSTSTSSVSGTIGVGGCVQKTPFIPGSFDARMPPPTFAITVDEVDKRRRSQDSVSAGGSDGEGPRSASPFGRSTAFVHDRDHSGDSDSGSSDISQTPAHHLPRKASPIAEEDESELFPLPSPRRSPSGSRSSSARSSPRNSPGVSPKSSPGPSPNASNSCLHPSSAAALPAALKPKQKTRSKESVSSEEVLVSNGISRRSDVSTVTPPQSGTSTPRANKPRLPSLSVPFPSAISPTTRKSSVNSETVTPSSNGDGGDTVPNSPVSPSADVPLSSSVTSVSTISSTASAQPKSPVTPTSPRPSIPSSGKGSRKISFGLPFLKASEALRGAGADVLRGVNSISSGGSSTMHIGGV